MIFFFCLETKEAKIQGSQIKSSKTTSRFAARTKPLAFQARLQVRSLAPLRCFLNFFFEDQKREEQFLKLKQT